LQKSGISGNAYAIPEMPRQLQERSFVRVGEKLAPVIGGIEVR
jgi:hypothetical protein